MNPTVYTNYQFTAAAWVLNERMVWHAQPNRMLAGLNYDKEGTLKIEGEDDVPLLQPWSFNIDEQLSPGAPDPAHSNPILKNTPVMPVQTLTFRVAVSRKDSWFRRDPTDATKKKGLMEWIALILDGMETTQEGTPDNGLEGTLERPMKASIRETETSQKAFHCFLTLELYVKHHCRGQRSYSLTDPDTL